VITIKEYDRRESKSNGDTFAGLEYDSEIIGSDGVMITLFVSTGTPFAVIEQAKAEARSQQNKPRPRPGHNATWLVLRLRKRRPVRMILTKTA